MKTDYIFEYVVEKQRKVGVLFAMALGKEIRIGWAKVNLKSGDTFSKNTGLDMAHARALGTMDVPALPPQMRPQMRAFQHRALTYFKQATLITSPQAARHIDLRDDGAKSNPIVNQVQAEAQSLMEILGIDPDSNVDPLDQLLGPDRADQLKGLATFIGLTAR
jgi:hypothetical protein